MDDFLQRTIIVAAIALDDTDGFSEISRVFNIVLAIHDLSGI